MCWTVEKRWKCMFSYYHGDSYCGEENGIFLLAGWWLGGDGSRNAPCGSLSAQRSGMSVTGRSRAHSWSQLCFSCSLAVSGLVKTSCCLFTIQVLQGVCRNNGKKFVIWVMWRLSPCLGSRKSRVRSVNLLMSSQMWNKMVFQFLFSIDLTHFPEPWKCKLKEKSI